MGSSTSTRVSIRMPNLAGPAAAQDWSASYVQHRAVCRPGFFLTAGYPMLKQ